MPNDELVKPVKLATMFKKQGIQGIRDASRSALANVDAKTVPNRYAIGFDDSGSMSGQPLADAKKAVAGFLGSCNPVETSVAVFPFNASSAPLSIDYTLVTAFTNGIKLSGCTPLYETMDAMLRDVDLTRGILFSDGQPDNDHDAPVIKAQERKIPFDCVYIGYGDSPVLRSIAERTGGEYLHFDDTTSFAKNLKYLSPKYVALLANAELKARIQKGESI